jgi:hypothetical protein
MKEKIKEFLEITQFYAMAKESIATLLSNDGIDTGVSEIFDISELEELLIPMYETKFTEDELDTIIYFFNSTVGQKMLRVNDELSNSINAVFNDWITKKYTAYLNQNV